MENLKTILAQCQECEVIKVGAINGTSYFYIGTVGDITESAEKYNAALRSYWKVKADRESNYIKKLSEATNISSYIRATKEKTLDTKGFLHYLDGVFRKINLATERMNDSMDHLRTFVPLMRRQVIRCERASDVVDNSLVIVLAGYEQGKLWTVQEIGDNKSMMALLNIGDYEDEVYS